jgi:hypothetical protein
MRGGIADAGAAGKIFVGVQLLRRDIRARGHSTPVVADH